MTAEDSSANPTSTATISLTVADLNGAEIQFKIRRNKPLEKLMVAYCNAKAIGDPKSVRFFHDGTRINPEDTPESREMEDGDQLECKWEQTGGREWGEWEEWL